MFLLWVLSIKFGTHFLYNRGMKNIDDNNEQVSKDWDNLIKSLDMFTDDFMDEEREQPEQEKREYFWWKIKSEPYRLITIVIR